MTMASRWMGTPLERRSVLRGAGLGLAGLTGAALFGCGGSQSSSGGESTGAQAGGQASVAGSGAPAKVTRADGFDPKLGTVPVNNKKLVKGGTYRRAGTDTSRENDPDVSIAQADWELVGDRLATANGFNMKLSLDMLASYEWIDKQNLVLKIRPGIKTHNVAPFNNRVFTAKDVAFNIKRKAGLLDPKLAAAKYPRYAQFDGITDAVAVDDVTVKVTLSKPNGSLMAALADPRANMIPVEMEQIGFKDPMKFGATGAWIPTSYVDGTRQTFKANPDYFRNFDEGARPGWDNYEKVVIVDRGSLVAAFISGQIDVLNAVQPQEEAQVFAVKGAQKSLTPGPTWDHFAVNLKLPQFQDDRVRQAFQLALDYKAFSDPLGAGWLYGGPVHTMFPESLTSDEIGKLPGYNAATKAADIANAQKLMEAAGFKEGAGIKFKQINSSAASLDSSVRLKDMWSKAFPKMDVVVSANSDYAQFTNALNSRTFEARSYNHTSVPDAALDAYTYYHTKGGRNYQSYSKPWADAAMDKLLLATTIEERKQIVQAFEKQYIQEGPPLLQIRHPADNIAIAGHVAGNDLCIGPWAYNSYGVSPRWTWQTEK
ncbi:MAG: ABC transporter substrate-binding protein [Chloroflexi bacterium]|nr:MAG: ABC transporter substrate-binding protein [Chloroflexota bacterium]